MTNGYKFIQFATVSGWGVAISDGLIFKKDTIHITDIAPSVAEILGLNISLMDGNAKIKSDIQ